MCVMYPAAGIIERIGPDWDWVWIDGQHGELGYHDILAAVRACNVIDRFALVRVPGHEAGPIGTVLDTDADAVMVPMVETADQAARLVEAAKFPPLGKRSYGGRRPIDRHTRAYAHPDRPQPMLVCQIETHAGLDHVEAIAAVEGVDALFFGPDDMALRDGLPMDQPRPAGHFDDALKTVADAANARGKIAAGVFPDEQGVRQAVNWGYRLIVGGGDVPFLATSSHARSQALRACLTNAQPTDADEPSKPSGVY